MVCFAEPWAANLTLTDGGYTLDLTFGRLDGALDLLDGEDDVLAIPPPSGSYAYFEIDDPANPYVTMLYSDMRPDDGDSALWIAHFFSSSPLLNASWDPALLPPGDFHIGAHYPLSDVAEWVNMKSVASLDYSPGMLLDIVHEPGGYHPEDSPVFANWSPYDGETGVPVTGSIRFDVTDEGSGIDPASIALSVGGTDVSAEIELSPIEDGYRVTYEPAMPLPGETWISVIASASDNAYSPHESSDIVAFRTGYSIEPALWEIPLTAYNIDGTDTSYTDISFGADPDAEATFDMGYDVVFPMAPPLVFYAFFPLDDPSYPLYSMLTRDIHSSDLFFDQWSLLFGNTDDAIGVKWDTDDIPTDKQAFIASSFISVYPDDGDWQDMTGIDHVEFGPGRQVWIKVITPSGDTLAPQVVYTDPADGETGVAVSTDIKAGLIDVGSGVDPTSISMVVDGVDATPYLLVSASGGTTSVRFIPSADFDPLQTVTVTIGADDLADPPNHMEYSWDFVTGYFLTPTWMESLFVWTDEPSELLLHFTLYFGADSMGTDAFDYGLDQQQPPAPPGDTPYGFFQIDDPMWGQLTRDIRSSDDDDIMWMAMMMRIPVDDSIDNWISWNPDYLPEDGSFEYAWWVAGDTVWENMRTTDNVIIETPGILLIHFTRGVPPTYCIAGTVYTDDGDPLEGAAVYISEELNALSDSDGYYRICEIPIGEYDIITSLEGYIADSTTINIDGDRTYNPVLYPIIPPSGTVHGMISCSDGGNPEGAMVVLDDDTTFADSTGYYAFYDVPYGDYSMFVSLEYYVPQDRDIVVDAADITEDFELNRQVGRMVGTITLSDDPPNLSGTMVELVGSSIPAAYTNASGFYLISDVPFGSYDVRISRVNYETLDTTFMLDAVEDTLDAELQSVFTLNPPRYLTGRAPYNNRIILNWDAPEPSTAHLLGYNVYRNTAFSGDTLVGYVPDPYSEFVE
ncbi:carboxypeptidase regulatory-like domain-containing protein, partial [bacterium]|nr:carboxypeptidase regulatory-like domain-containing protein [bacterium]